MLNNYSFSHYENLVKPESEFYNYVKDTIDTSDLPPKSKKPSIYESTTRFLGHLLQYLGEINENKLVKMTCCIQFNFQGHL